MATLVLGIVGAGVGSFFGNPWLGFSVGTTLGGLLFSSNQSGTNTQSGRLADLRVSFSAYGTMIPLAWGNFRLPGLIIFSTDLQEHSQTIDTGGGGKGSGGGPTTTDYWYTATFAAAFCKGSYLNTDGSFTERFTSSSLTRIWFDDLIVMDSITPSDIGTWYDDEANEVSAAIDYVFYPGNETQTEDPTIAAWVAANPLEYIQGVTPAYRGIVYIVFLNVNLQPYGNRLPNVSAEFTSNSVMITDVITDVAALCNVSSSELDNTLADTVPMFGYQVTSQGAGADILQPMLQLYMADLPEVDGVLRTVPRGLAAVDTVDYNDLNSVTVEPGHGATDVPADSAHVNEQYSDVSELPSRIDITYYSHSTNANLDRHYEQATQGDARQYAYTLNPVAITVSLTLDDTQALQMAMAQLDVSWTEQASFKFSLPPKYIWIAPGDCLDLPVGNLVQRVRILSMEVGIGGQINFEAILDSTAAVTQVAVSENNGTIPTVPIIPYVQHFQAWSGTELRDTDEAAPGFYVAADGPGSIYYSPDGGTTWISCGPVRGTAILGVMTSVLSASGAVAGSFDHTNTATVTLDDAGTSISSTSETAVSNTQNIAVVGGEILGFATASITSALHYTVSDLLRGLRGSTMTGHSSGERFVVASASAITRISVPVALIGSTILVDMVEPGASPTIGGSQSVTITPPTLSPTQVQLNAIRTPPVYYGQYLFDSLTSIPTPGSFGTPDATDLHYAESLDGVFRFETPGMQVAAMWGIGLTNSTGSPITVNWKIPASDNGCAVYWNGSVLYSGVNLNTQTGTFVIAAGQSALLQLLYYNTAGGRVNYNPSNQGSFWFFMDALSNAGVSWYCTQAGALGGGSYGGTAGATGPAGPAMATYTDWFPKASITSAVLPNLTYMPDGNLFELEIDGVGRPPDGIAYTRTGLAITLGSSSVAYGSIQEGVLVRYSH
jgi:hypothetical protein